MILTCTATLSFANPFSPTSRTVCSYLGVYGVVKSREREDAVVVRGQSAVLFGTSEAGSPVTSSL